MISFDNVSKFILSDISIHIPEGISIGVIGASGAGKTTFIRLICGLLKADRGEVYTGGHNPTSILGRKENFIRVLLENTSNLQMEESVADNFYNLKLIYGIKDIDYDVEYKRLSKEFGFFEFQNERVKNLSLGQRRRAELGAVLIHKPKLLLLDEPTIGLDFNAKKTIRNIILDREKEGLTTVVTSQDMADISGICSRICILNKGKLCYYGNEDLMLKEYAPVDVMYITLQNKIPDIEDLPVKKYSIDGEKLKLIYNSNHITSAEILRVILSKCSVKEVNMCKPELADVIMRIEKGITDV